MQQLTVSYKSSVHEPTMTATSAPTSGLQLLLLGGFLARLNGQLMSEVSYAKMRALLAYLVIEGDREHKREALADLLWSHSSAITARGNLRRTLADLRRVLELPSGEVMFVASKNSIRFVAKVDVDVLIFTGQRSTSSDDAVQALHRDEHLLSLYRGEFLAGLSVSDSPNFEHWLQIQRESLRLRALALLESLSNRYESMGNNTKALEFALRYCELEPLNEDACRRVMLLHASSGLDKAALSQYEACCRQLKAELGVLPSEETQQLAKRIRQGTVPRKLALAQPGPLAQAPTQASAQRCQVTVMYCELTHDLIDDPDEAMALLHAPQERCVAIIEQFSGHVVQAHGGALLAYFGYPRAHENAARLAVLAALTVTRESVCGIDIRAGVHTGLIITGRDSSIPDTSGKTTRIAMALRPSTEQCKVAISQDTHALVAGYFECISQGMQALSGLQQSREIFRVDRKSVV